MSDTNTERRNAAPGLRIRTEIGDLDLLEVREKAKFHALAGDASPATYGAVTILVLLDALEAALNTDPECGPHTGHAVTITREMIHRAAGVIPDDAPELPPWLTRDQALEAARASDPELRIVGYRAAERDGKPVWYVIVSDGKSETELDFPRALEEGVS